VTAFLLGLALVLQVSEPVQSAFQRQRQNHTIYMVRGSADQLKRFQSEVASSWKGGVLLADRSGPSEYHYWAFAQRTAPQGREFIFGSMMSGLQLDMETYEEKAFFPTERAALNDIVVSCSLKTDPFFITPRREIMLESAEDNDACAERKLEASDRLKGLRRYSPASEQRN
jgi:hypothetical protein